MKAAAEPGSLSVAEQKRLLSALASHATELRASRSNYAAHAMEFVNQHAARIDQLEESVRAVGQETVHKVNSHTDEALKPLLLQAAGKVLPRQAGQSAAEELLQIDQVLPSLRARRKALVIDARTEVGEERRANKAAETLQKEEAKAKDRQAKVEAKAKARQVKRSAPPASVFEGPLPQAPKASSASATPAAPSKKSDRRGHHKDDKAARRARRAVRHAARDAARETPVVAPAASPAVPGFQLFPPDEPEETLAAAPA